MILDDEPGQFFVRDEPPAPAWPTTPGTFARLGERVQNHLEAGDQLLGAAARDVASTDDGGLDQAFTSTIGAAGELYDTEKNGDGDQTPSVLIVNGAPTEELENQSRPYLPPSATPISIDFADAPPQPQAGQPGDTSSDAEQDRPDTQA